MNRLIALFALVPALSACDALKDRLGLPDPARLEAEGKAVGAGCRHAGRGLEDCYTLNPKADKPAVFAGWKEMNEYMIKNNMQAMAPEAVHPAETPAPPAAEPHGKPAEPPAKAAEAAAKPGETKPAEAKPAEAKAAGH